VGDNIGLKIDFLQSTFAFFRVSSIYTVWLLFLVFDEEVAVADCCEYAVGGFLIW
jgi:hypothetical protein